MFRTEKFVHIIMVIVLAVVCLGCTALAEEVPYSFTYTTLADGTLSITGVDGDTSGTIEVPGAIDGVAVTQIGYGAFRDASVEEVILPDGITSIGNSAFQYCYDLKKINIPDSVVSIDNYAFYENQSLKEITIPDSVTGIGTYAFRIAIIWRRLPCLRDLPKSRNTPLRGVNALRRSRSPKA